MAGVGYRYELWRGEELTSTGHLTRERRLEVGDWVVIGGRPGVVRVVEPLLGERELRLVVGMHLDDESGARCARRR